MVQAAAGAVTTPRRDKTKEIGLYPFSPSKAANAIKNALDELCQNPADGLPLCPFSPEKQHALQSSLQPAFQPCARGESILAAKLY